MDIRSKMEAIDGIVKDNKLSVHKKFNCDFIVHRGFFSGVSKTAEGAIDALFGLCVYGVNNGFGDVKEEIDDLSSLIVAMAELKNDDSKKRKTEKEVKKIMERTARYTVENDPRETVIEYARTTKEAIDTMIANPELFGGRVSARMIPNLEELKKVLAEIEEVMPKISDLSSEEARNHACRVVFYILEARDSLVRGFCSNREIDFVKNSLRYAKSWAELTQRVGRRDRAKEDFPRFAEDGISTLAYSGKAIADFELFKELIDKREEELYSSSPVANAIKGREEARAKADAVKAEMQELKKRIINGGANADTDAKAAILLSEFKRYDRQYEDYSRRVEELTKANSGKISILTSFKEKIVDVIEEEVRENPVVATSVIAHMNFSAIMGVVSGDYSEKTVLEAQDTLARAMEIATEQENARISALNSLRDTVDVADRLRAEKTVQEIPEPERERAKRTAGSSAELLEFLEEDEKKEREEGERSTESDPIIHIGDDDK